MRLDTNLWHHDKTLRVMGQRNGHRAMALYLFALQWSGGTGTDGHIPAVVVPLLHGSQADASTLADAGLWDPDPEGDGWWIHNYAQRQETSDASEARRTKAQNAARARWDKPK